MNRQEEYIAAIDNPLKSNNRAEVEMLLLFYKECKDHSLPKHHPLSVICSEDVTVETFNWMLQHPKLQSDLNNIPLCKAFIEKLIEQNAKDKMESLTNQADWQIKLTKLILPTADKKNETGQLICEKVPAIVLLYALLKKDYSHLAVINYLTNENLLNRTLESLPFSPLDKNRIQFILSEFQNKPIETKTEKDTEFNFDWYNQAFLFAKTCSAKINFEDRQNNIRERAFLELKKFIFKLPGEEENFMDRTC